MTCSDATWLCWRAHVESGCSGPTGGQSICCQVQVLEHSPQGGEGVGLGYGTKLSGYTDLGSPREQAPLPRTRLQATVERATGVDLSDRGERSPPERATGVDFELLPSIHRDMLRTLRWGIRKPRLTLERSPDP